MNDLVVIKAFDFYRKNKLYDKIGKLIKEYCNNFSGTHEEIIEILIKKFNSLLSQYDKNELLILQSFIEEQILKLRQMDETISYSKEEIEFHIHYFNLIAYTIKEVEENEKFFFKTLKERVERASDLLKNSKIQTNLQLLKADLNQKSQLLLETGGNNGTPIKQDKIKNVSQMNKSLKLKTIKSYALYDVTEFCNFMLKLESKNFFYKLENDYSTKEALEIYQNYQFFTSQKHESNFIYHYNHPKSKVLAYFLDVHSEEEYNQKVMSIVEKDNLTDVQRKMYERVLTQKQTLNQNLSLAKFKHNQSLTEEEKKKIWGRNYLQNMNAGIKMPLSNLISSGSFFLQEVFKSTELRTWMLGEVNEVEAIYKTNDHKLSYHFDMQNKSFSGFGRINYSIIENAGYFFNEKDVVDFYHWIFDCIEIVSPKTMRDPETKEESNFLIQFLKYRLKNHTISKEEFYYLFTVDSLKPMSRGNNPSEIVFELLEYAMNNFSVNIEMDIFLKIMRQFDKEGSSLFIMEKIYPEEFNFVRSLLNELVAEGNYENIESAYLDFLK